MKEANAFHDGLASVMPYVALRDIAMPFGMLSLIRYTVRMKRSPSAWQSGLKYLDLAPTVTEPRSGR